MKREVMYRATMPWFSRALRDVVKVMRRLSKAKHGNVKEMRRYAAFCAGVVMYRFDS